MDRRKVLGLLGGTLSVTLAGCLGDDDDDGDDANGDENGTDDPNGDEDPAASSLSDLTVGGEDLPLTVELGEVTDIGVLVENVGEQAGSFDVSLDVGDVVDETESTGEIAGGDSETVTFEHVLGDLEAGEHDIVVSTDDDSTEGLLTLVVPAEFQVSDLEPSELDLDLGSLLDVSAVVENVGGVEGTQPIELAVGTVTEQQDLTLEPGDSETVAFEDIDLADLAEDHYTYTISSADDSVSGTLTFGSPGEVEAPIGDDFTATSRGGFIGIGEDNEEDAREEGFDLPPSEDVPEPISLNGVIEDGSWHSIVVNFPDLDPSVLLDDLEGLPIDEDDVEIQVNAPEGFSGEVDWATGLMTLDGDLEILVLIAGEEIPVRVNLNGTTGASGALTGDMDIEVQPVTATLVDNETIVEEIDEDEHGFVGPIANDELGLPAESGEVWIELDFDLEDALSVAVDPGTVDVENDFVVGADVGDSTDDTDIEAIVFDFDSESDIDTAAITADDVTLTTTDGLEPGVDSVQENEPSELLITPENTFTLSEITGAVELTIDDVVAPETGTYQCRLEFQDDANERVARQFGPYTIE